jgi:hypothetical protein
MLSVESYKPVDQPVDRAAMEAEELYQRRRLLDESIGEDGDFSYWDPDRVLARHRAMMSPEELRVHLAECAERERRFAEDAKYFSSPWTLADHRKFRIECMGYDEDYYKHYPYSGENVAQ